jgi:hypothetical protein
METQGLDGELWLPANLFHAHDEPSVFSPDEDWTCEFLPLAHADMSRSSPPLPCLLDSPPRHDTSPTPTDIHELYASFITVSSTPVITTPPNPTQPASTMTEAVDEALCLTMCRNKRIATQLPSSAKQAERARDTKLKKLGIPTTHANSKADKKTQLLKKLGESVSDNADEALS